MKRTLKDGYLLCFTVLIIRHYQIKKRIILHQNIVSLLVLAWKCEVWCLFCKFIDSLEL